ncbi:MAG TPA: hypothetical protein VHU86_00595 [Solirubrobacterales bacterium]|jgi:hypothetical protein|nr:hypothetical protein [Solirubrobacterales bacterium]
MSRNLRISKLIAGAFVALLAMAGLALAAAPEQTRESYVAQVEPICKTNTKANERILAGARKEVKEGELKVAAGQFTRAAAAFGKTVKLIAAVPRPSADSAKLAQWIGHLEAEQKLLSEIAKALKAGKKGRVQTLDVQLNNNSNITNNTVIEFGFNYCLIKQSRFS